MNRLPMLFIAGEIIAMISIAVASFQFKPPNDDPKVAWHQMVEAKLEDAKIGEPDTVRPSKRFRIIEQNRDSYGGIWVADSNGGMAGILNDRYSGPYIAIWPRNSRAYPTIALSEHGIQFRGENLKPHFLSLESLERLEQFIEHSNQGE